MYNILILIAIDFIPYYKSYLFIDNNSSSNITKITIFNIGRVLLK